MNNTIEVKVPDIGGSSNVDVIDVLVKPGDTIKVEDSLITLETDKATMEVPSTEAGVVKSIAVKVGDKVSEGTVILTLESANADAPVVNTNAPEVQAQKVQAQPPATLASSVVELKVPDIGGNSNVDVIDVLVKPGDTIKQDDSLITLETDKATMEVPATQGGVVRDVAIKVGDKVSEGSLILTLEATGSAAAAASMPAAAAAPAPQASAPAAQAPAAPSTQAPSPAKTAEPGNGATRLGIIDEAAFRAAHATPSVRRLARELGADLGRIKGTGPKGRITKEDVETFVKAAQAPQAQAAAPAGGSGVGLDLLPWPQVDFAKFGPIEVKPLSRIKKISAANLTRNAIVIPHVTFNDEADVTEMEAFRKATAAELEKEGLKVSPLAFIIKAAAVALKAFPEFNSSLDGDNLILKQYYHIGFAADTPNGLVVPVIRDVDQKGIKQIAKELTDLSKLARDGKLKPTDMQGATFTISSLGGIGGTSFTPIINAPEVAILGVCKSQMKPVWNGKEFEPRLMCPLSLSFDHRVIDGAAAARFTVYLAKLLADVRRLIL